MNWIRLNLAFTGADCQGLCKSRDTFEQYVSAGEHSYHQILDQMLLSDYDLAHLKRKKIDERTFLLNALIEFLYVYTFHIF